MPDERLLIDGREAAKLLGGISTRTLYSKSAPRGPIPCVRLSSQLVRYVPDDLREWIAANKVKEQTQ